jgi:hypothetical protein
MTAIKHRCDEKGGGWTLDTLQEHWQVISGLQREFLEERDRRYSEVKAAEEKALAVKQRADEQALGLAREIQIYKDEKANELRSQIERERGSYATKDDLAAAIRELNATLSPLTTYVSSQSGAVQQAEQQRQNTRTITSILVAIIGALSLLLTFGGFVLFRH